MGLDVCHGVICKNFVATDRLLHKEARGWLTDLGLAAEQRVMRAPAGSSKPTRSSNSTRFPFRQ